MVLPAGQDNEGIEAYLLSLFRRYDGAEHEVLMENGSKKHRLTLTDLHGELMFASRARRFQGWGDRDQEPDWLGDLYRELLPELTVHEAKPTMLSEHEAALRESYLANRESGAFARSWGRQSPRTWLTSLKREDLTAQLAEAFPDKVLSRGELRRLLWNTAEPKHAGLLVLAWGEMAPRNAKRFLEVNDEQPWVDLVARLRGSEFTREEAYDRFRQLADDKKIEFLGPAYFTKLIFFLRPPEVDETDTGFIMDQWTATSINLLFGHTIVKMNKAATGKCYVSRRNTGRDYEAFCRLIEYVAHQWRARAEDLEMTLFGRGGTNRDDWRKHVLASLHASK